MEKNLKKLSLSTLSCLKQAQPNVFQETKKVRQIYDRFTKLPVDVSINFQQQ